MRAVVVYESVFGNTREVAEAVAEGLAEVADVAVCSVEGATPEALAGAELVVVGGPTHAHGMTSSSSRKAAVQSAAKKGEDVDEFAEGPGLRSWFHDLPEVSRVGGAAFDTRASGPKILTGSAANGIARRLRHHGYALVGDPESFLVKDAEGPLEDGEHERARAWGAARRRERQVGETGAESRRLAGPDPGKADRRRSTELSPSAQAPIDIRKSRALSTKCSPIGWTDPYYPARYCA